MTHAYIQLDERGVNVQDCLDAVGRAERRKSGLAVGLTVALALSLGVGAIVWWTLSTERDQLQHQVTQERFFRMAAEAKVACLEDRNPVFGLRVQRRGQLDACVTAELARMEKAIGLARRGSERDEAR